MSTRYYNPEVGRFLNADALASTGQGLLGNNMFAYCCNNPIVFKDSSGAMCVPVRDVNGGKPKPKTNPYDVPLYDQGDTNLCGLYCQVMVEDFNIGIERGSEAVDAAVNNLAANLNGNSGTYPTNCAAYGPNGCPIIATDIDSIEDLEAHLVENGPIYALYKSNEMKDGAHRYHMVVVTGTSAVANQIYTNNPWGKRGIQTYEQFLNGFVGSTTSYSLLYLIPIA